VVQRRPTWPRISTSRRATTWLFVRKLRPLLKRATVFLSYAMRGDKDIVQQIHDALVEQDYRVFFDQLLTAGVDFRAKLQFELENAVEHGFVLLLLSPEYLTSPWCAKERQAVFDILGSRPVSNIVPVIVRDPKTVYAKLPPDLQNLQCHDMTKGPVVRNIMALMRDLKTRPMA
jgi:hypothetical protein